jgi:flagellar biosynthetic protein FlhB
MKQILQALLFLIFPLSLFAQSGMLSGKLTNAANGAAISPAKVAIVELQLLKAVDLDGRFVFEALKPGIYTVKITAPGFDEKIQSEVQITNARPTELNLELEEKIQTAKDVKVTAAPFQRKVESPNSLKTLSELLKNFIKTTLMLGVGFTYLVGLFSYIRSIVNLGFDAALVQTSSFILDGFMLLLLPLLLIAVGDSWLQWFNFRKQIRMSPEEMKQEGKETDGSPEIKQRLRQLQRQMSTSRMMAAIERADVVLANPEHYSVALRYDMEKMSAPIVVAKGADQMALRIQEVATEFEVPIARIPPLARYLYSQLEIGESIPLPLFEAIAQILAWAYDTKASDTPGEVPQVDFIPTQLKPGKPLLL